MVSLDLIPERVLVFLNSLLGQITWLRTLLPKDFNIDDTSILVAGVLHDSELLLMCVHFVCHTRRQTETIAFSRGSEETFRL